MLKIDYDSRKHITTDTSINDVIDSPSINIYTTDVGNQNMSPVSNFLLEWHFRLDIPISMTLILFFVRLLLEQINLSPPVAYPLNNAPNIKSVSMQNQSACLFPERKHILVFLIEDISMTITSDLVMVCM